MKKKAFGMIVFMAVLAMTSGILLAAAQKVDVELEPCPTNEFSPIKPNPP